MGLTVSRKTAKNLAVRRKNERILTVSRKKMLTVKKSNHKIRSRVLLLSLMCYAFMCSGSENYNRNRKCRKCPIDQRTKAISAVQSSWQTTRVTLIHTILTKIQSSFFQFMWYSLSFNGGRTLSWWLNDKMTMSKEATPRTHKKNRNHQLKGNHVKMQKRIERLWRNLKKIMR